MTAAEREQLRAIPKAEMHLHLEGSLSPATLWRLAQRYECPMGLTGLSACEQLYRFNDFAGFIHAIKTASQLLREPAEYAEAVEALAAYFHDQGVTYAEVFVSIGILLWRKVRVEPYWEAIVEATQLAEAKTGVRMIWLFDAVRQFGPDAADAVVGWAIKLQSSNLVRGIGIGGNEAVVHAAEFAPCYARARAAGLQTTIHAGETCGPESIWDCLRHLHPDRIGHGLNAILDPRLVDYLIEHQTALDVCPTSNYKTGALPVGQTHPVREYYKRGVNISISSDDPGIFGCSLLGEYAWLADHAGFTFDEVCELARRVHV